MTSPSSPAVLELDDVLVRLGGVTILEHLHLSLPPGELVWLLGANGAGKSTLLRTLAGLLPFDGEVRVCGHRPRSLAGRAAFVFVPDEAPLYEDLTLAEHAAFSALAYAQPEAEGRTLELLERFGLSARLGEFPSSHSRGMRQKLALSLALGLEVPLLLLDEPFNGLDAAAQEVLSELLAARAAAGGVVVLSAHQSDLRSRLSARPLSLVGGRLEEAPVGA